MKAKEESTFFSESKSCGYNFLFQKEYFLWKKNAKLSPRNLMPDLLFLYILNLSHFSMSVKLACLITESCFIHMQEESGLSVN